MKDIGSELRYFIEEHHLVQDEIAEKCGYSHSHFWQILQKSDMKCSMLEKICSVMQLNPSFFFGEVEHIQEDSKQIESSLDSNKDIAFYKKLLAEKDARIEVLERNASLSADLLAMYRDGNGTNQRKSAV